MLSLSCKREYRCLSWCIQWLIQTCHLQEKPGDIVYLLEPYATSPKEVMGALPKGVGVPHPLEEISQQTCCFRNSANTPSTVAIA